MPLRTKFGTSPKGPKSSKPEKSGKVPVTYMFPRNLEKNLSAYCFVTGQSKTAVVTTALKEFLIEKDLQPDKEPVITYEGN